MNGPDPSVEALLRSTLDELATTTAELQSASGELQFANEQLATLHDELRERTTELDRANAILASLGLAVAVVDRTQRVQVWNQHAEDLWGVRGDEATDQQFLALDIGLEPARLAPALRAVIGGTSGAEHARLAAVDRRGRPVVCATTVLPLRAPGSNGLEILGAVVLMAADGAGPA